MSDRITPIEPITPAGDTRVHNVVILQDDGSRLALSENPSGDVTLVVDDIFAGVRAVMRLRPMDVGALRVFVDAYCLTRYIAGGEKTERERPTP